MRVSVIVTARDEEPAILEATLAGLHATTRHLDTEVIVIDDGSRVPVGCGAWPVRLLRNPVAAGCCASRAMGARAATGEVLVWLDAHMSFGENWLEQMLVWAGTGALLCSPFWSYDLTDCMCWGADFTWRGQRDYAAQIYPGFGVAHRVSAPAELAAETPMAIGACYMMQRDSYRSIGGFCPHFRVWGADEQDISARAWMAGLGVRCVSLARVGHLTRVQFPYPVRFEHLEFNQLVMLRSLFEPETVRRLERCFHPLAGEVEAWLADTDLSGWRRTVQSARKLSDQDFFARFAPDLLACTR
jgi:polypeptide N-acetylgalactosaminyltransferase